ncbi:isocitrate/isopropylmalate dehydrogenase family protein [Pseudomonas viridiflava]|uniref:isocitrate/isopropylmalate dehydrogenase family protein n=2 Tax=Pseudomonas viridiflava TaxID=33069 RepID=UPI000F025FE7|nr:isocitrate/isopropylmalate family dehydrogenase [Pseudomonas viridiflava]MCQ9390546.1 isocitrate/isopropylmalate family dehydrogenase [Pseudomonas viridiflava]
MTQSKTKRICVLPGDGVGVEVMDVAIPVLQALGLDFQLDYGEIGWECWKREGNTVPQATWTKIAQADATLLGAITSKPLKEAELELPSTLQGKNHPFVSPVIQLRQNLGLYANVRPVTDILGENRFRFVVIRENTEGLYAGLDYDHIPAEFLPVLERREANGASWIRHTSTDAAMSVRLQTRHGLTRLFRFSFDYARLHGYTHVTLADKPNVLRHSSAFTRAILEEVALDYPDIGYSVDNIDAAALWMVRRPERFGVIVAENMFGDILSDLGAGVMGGLGLAPSANIGDTGAYFEPVHGSAPAHAGLNKANPSAMFLSIGLMLEHLGYSSEASIIAHAVADVARSSVRTYDLKGTSTTRDVAHAVIARCLELNRIGAPRMVVNNVQGGVHVSAL